MHTSIILPNHHPYICYESDIRLIWQPIFEKFKLNIFVFIRYYHDSSCAIQQESLITNFVHDNNKNKLSKQQLKIMYWVSKGQSARKIAENMSLSRRTIENHLAALKIKLSAASKSELIEKSIHCYHFGLI